MKCRSKKIFICQLNHQRLASKGEGSGGLGKEAYEVMKFLEERRNPISIEKSRLKDRDGGEGKRASSPATS